MYLNKTQYFSFVAISLLLNQKHIRKIVESRELG